MQLDDGNPEQVNGVNLQEGDAIVDLARGSQRLKFTTGGSIPTILTKVKYYHAGRQQVLGAADLMAAQGFSPEDVARFDFSGMSYSSINALMGIQGLLPPKYI